jgi:molecular chaperone GrpE
LKQEKNNKDFKKQENIQENNNENVKQDQNNCNKKDEHANKIEEIKNSEQNDETLKLSELELAQKEIEELKEKNLEQKNEHLRAHAELENMKKRLEREKYQAIDYASEKFALDLLAPLDSLQMAISSTKNSNIEAQKLLENLKEGIELTMKNFNTVFEKHDINEVEYIEFNPEFHSGVMQEANEEFDDGAIIEVMQKGYMLKDRLLRPAMVKICKK